jgi:putative peptidoglycan lipid II flippase
MNRNIFRAANVVGGGTGLSRLLGLVREILMAWMFGTSLAKSAFDVAFLIPNLFRRLFGEGALSAAFVPVFTETLEHDGLDGANRLAGKIGTLLATILFLSVCVGYVVMVFVQNTFEIGEKATAVLSLLRVMLPYLFFICLVALSMGMLNSLRHFAIPALTPVLLNVVWISALIWICPHLGDTLEQKIQGVAMAVLFAGGVQLLVQLPVLLKKGLRPTFSFDWQDSRVRRVLLMMGPAALGMGIFQINVVIDKILAFYVGDWAPAALNYAERLIYLPLGLVATALGTVLLPTFSSYAARNEPHLIRETLGSALRYVLFIMVPATVGLIVLAQPIVDLIYHLPGKRFDALSTLQTTRALVFYAPGLIVFSAYKVLVPAFYAQKNTITPVKVGACVLLLNLALNIIFILTWPPGFKHAGLAFATVIASLVNCTALSVILHRQLGNPGWQSISLSAVKSILGALIMGVTVGGVHNLVTSLPVAAQVHVKVAQIATVLVSIIAGLAVYAVWALIACRDEMKALRRR